MKHLLAVLLCAGCIANASAQNNCCGNGEKKTIEGYFDLSAINSIRIDETTLHGFEAGIQVFVTKHFGLCGTMGLSTVHTNHLYERAIDLTGGLCGKIAWQHAMLKIQYGKSNSQGELNDSKYYDLGVSIAPKYLSLGKADFRFGIGVKHFNSHKPKNIFPKNVPYFTVGISI